MPRDTLVWGRGKISWSFMLHKLLKLHFASTVSSLAVSHASLLKMSLNGF